MVEVEQHFVVVNAGVFDFLGELNTLDGALEREPILLIVVDCRDGVGDELQDAVLNNAACGLGGQIPLVGLEQTF